MTRALGGFLAGFVAVLTVHQALLWLGTQLHWLQASPWSMRAVPPFRIPAVLSLAFWGGVWGILIAFVAPRIGTGFGYWLSVFVIFGLATTLVGWYVVGPLKGASVEELTLGRLLPGLVVNGLWAVATATIAAALPGRLRSA
jgi:MFS family permease